METLFRRIANAVLACSLFFSSAAAYAADDTPRLTPTEAEAAIVYRTCLRASDEQVARCRARALQRWQQSQKLTRATDAYQLYDRYDWGRNHLRNTKQEERRQTLRERALRRRTFREQPVNLDLDVGSRTYLQDYQRDRLECHLKPAGRQRSACFDAVAQKLRAQSKAAGGSRQYPAK